jgi:predicted KAP-like P-loop ATPase
VANVDASLMQQIFDIAKRKRKLNIKHYRQTDDFGGRVEVAIWILGMPLNLKSGQGGLERFYSDRSQLLDGRVKLGVGQCTSSCVGPNT